MPTENHELNTPAEGSTDWHIPINENFRKIDEHLAHTLSTDTGTASDKIIVAETASDIQDALDTLDGRTTRYDDKGRASRPGGGAVLLKRNEYLPESPITMRPGTRIVGFQQDLLLGRNNHEWQYSVISGRNLSAGDPIIEYPENGEHAGMHNLILSGGSNDVHGVKIKSGFGATYHSNLVITRCRGSGFWTRGTLDTWLRDVSCKDNGSLASNNALGYDAPSVRIESENDSVGSGSNDTQIRWYGGRISAGDAVPAVEASSSLQRFYDCTIKMATKPSTETPVVDFTEGSLLELMRCTIDGYRNEHSVGILRGNNNTRLVDSLVEKCGTGVKGSGNLKNMIANTKFRDFANHALEFGQRGALMSNVQIRGSDGDAILVDGANISQPWTNLSIVNNSGYAIKITGVRGGKPGDVPVVSNLYAPNNGSGLTNAPDLLILDGKWVEPYTYDMGGSSGELDVSTKPANPIDVRVDGGGADVSVTGLTGPTDGGRTVVVEHAGTDAITFSHADGSASRPLLNSGGSDVTIDSNGAVIAYRFDGSRDSWREIWRNTV